MTATSDDVAYRCTRAIREALRAADVENGRDHRAVAIRQAAEMEAQRLVNVELRRERDQAIAGREAALDLAAEYARRAGIDPSRDAALKYVAGYWDRDARLSSAFDLFERQRWDTLHLARDMERFARGEMTVKGAADMAALVGALARELTRLHTTQGPQRRSADLFVRPSVPGTATSASGVTPAVDVHPVPDEPDGALFAVEPARVPRVRDAELAGDRL